ncbi:MAG: hypothetical protein HRT47_03190 [Candidatus Caenarcaniphilales bacterium]|nr:hypothetical protein [Candidatus Caenarcaniphilales bacterium]
MLGGDTAIDKLVGYIITKPDKTLDKIENFILGDPNKETDNNNYHHQAPATRNSFKSLAHAPKYITESIRRLSVYPEPEEREKIPRSLFQKLDLLVDVRPKIKLYENKETLVNMLLSDDQINTQDILLFNEGEEIDTGTKEKYIVSEDSHAVLMKSFGGDQNRVNLNGFLKVHNESSPEIQYKFPIAFSYENNIRSVIEKEINNFLVEPLSKLVKEEGVNSIKDGHRSLNIESLLPKELEIEAYDIKLLKAGNPFEETNYEYLNESSKSKFKIPVTVSVNDSSKTKEYEFNAELERLS